MVGKKMDRHSAAWCMSIILLCCQFPLFAQSETLITTEKPLEEALLISASPASVPYFSGNSYQMPNARYNGDPWLFASLLAGSLHWIGSEYDVSRLRYDLVLDQVTVLIPSPERDALISLSPSLVDRFSIEGRTFFMPQFLPEGQVPSALEQGYHEQVYVGDSIAFIVKHQKELLSENQSYTIEYSYDVQTSRFAYIHGEYHKFKSQGALLKAMKKYKKEIKNMIRDRSILVGKATQQELIPLFELYESLSARE